MIKVENIDTWGFEHAIRGMRNPLNSWDKSDSYFGCGENKCRRCTDYCDWREQNYILGENDFGLMRKLFKAGTEHRKYLRQIFVSMDIVAPLYWWKEFDTYKVGTVANSCSTMHQIHAKEFTLNDFSHEHLLYVYEHPTIYEKNGNTKIYCCFKKSLEDTIKMLNHARALYLETKDKDYWWQMIQLLPSSYNQRRTVTMNYENVVNMIKQRENHKLKEWREFTDILKELPHVKRIMDGNTYD